MPPSMLKFTDMSSPCLRSTGFIFVRLCEYPWQA